MVKRDRLVISNLLKHWRGKFEKSRHQVTPAAISSAMVVSLVDGGLWFRRHFSMLVLSTLVACMRNGYANQMYFHHFDDVKRIRDLNWCKLLVDSLVETQAAWKSGSHKCFVGPAEFVAELLQERELSEIRLGGFGRGVIELPLLNGGNVDSGGGHPQGSDVVTFDDFVTEKSAAMARDFLELCRVFKNASQGVFDGQVSRQMREAILLLVGVKQPPPSSGSDACKSSQPTFSQREDLFWSDAQNIRAVEDIQRAIWERNEFMDMPSFSLGFTHEFNDGVRAVVDDIARDYGPVGDGYVSRDHAPGNMNAPRGVDADCDSPVEGFCDENVGAGGGSGLTTSPVPPVVGGAETLLQAAGPEVDLAARNSIPLVSTPLEKLVDQQDGGETSRSGSLVCGAPVKMVCAVRPPPVACRRLGSLDGSSGVASQYGLDAVHDLPEEVDVV
nr:uncharacterized protein LOC109182830 [Ipomoea trifida]